MPHSGSLRAARHRPGPPELLVSVRHPAEVPAALAGGASIIDVKDPSRGPLGRADAGVWQLIAQTTGNHAPLSLAWGELAEWGPATPLPPLPHGTQFLKLGVAGLAVNEIARRWHSLRHRFALQHPFSGGDSPPSSRPASDLTGGSPPPPGPEWVLACYADHAAAQAPAPEPLFALARELGCRTVLVDTHDKQGPRLTDLYALEQLVEWVALTTRLGLKLALAGRLQLTDARLLARVGPAIVGIRSAACLAGNRQGGVDAGLVRAFAQELAAGPDSIPGSAPATSRVAQPGTCPG
ncbi:MAG: (5-formylfuran-3-yl)methyl phosphate synthase [Planctomycetaceae bacterium]